MKVPGHLEDLDRARVFRPGVPFGEELAALHVPFDDLVGDRGYESRVRSKVRAGGLVLVIGATGSGKSGLSSCALSIYEGIVAVPVPVSVPKPDGAEPSDIPELVLAGLANTLVTLDEYAAADAQLAARQHRRQRRLRMKPVEIKGTLVIDLTNQLADRTLTLGEQRDQIHQALETLRGGDLEPVVVLDDTDKWASAEDRLRSGRRFFEIAAAALVDLDVALVAHAHPRYFDGHPRPDHFEGVVTVPRVDASSVKRILDHRIAVASMDAGLPACGLDDIFEPDAADRLANWYTADERISLRRVMHVAAQALVEAVEAKTPRVNVGAIENSIALN